MLITSSAPPASNPWIISRSQDLVWFQDSVIAGLFLLLLFLLLPGLDYANHSMVHHAGLIPLAWGVMLNGTPVISTYARTYFAKDVESRASLPGNWGWTLLLAGAAVALVNHTLFEPAPRPQGTAPYQEGRFGRRLSR